jgi:putative NADH-flavin reductase
VLDNFEEREMKILVYGGTGRVGSAVVAEAAARGHEVIAASRRAPERELPHGATWQPGDATDLDGVAKTATDVDVVVSALGPSREPGGDPFAFAGIVAGLAEAVGGTRLAVVGGAGSLVVSPGPDAGHDDPAGTGAGVVRLVDTPEFPAIYKTEALASADALEVLRGTGPEVDWTFLSPAPVIDEGERTGSYRVGADSPVGTFVSFADYAAALVDELERPAHRRTRRTVATP